MNQMNTAAFKERLLAKQQELLDSIARSDSDARARERGLVHAAINRLTRRRLLDCHVTTVSRLRGAARWLVSRRARSRRTALNSGEDTSRGRGKSMRMSL